MRKVWIFGFLTAAVLSAQPATVAAAHVRFGATLPATCKTTTGDVFFLTSGTTGVYSCTSTNTWTQPGSGGGGGATIPSVTNLISGDGAGNGADSGIVPANVEQSSSNIGSLTIIKSGGGRSAVGSGIGESGGALFATAGNSGNLTYGAGQDTNANNKLGSATVRGGNVNGSGGAASSGGDVVVTGGSNVATNAASQGGNVAIIPGPSTGATQGLQGWLEIFHYYVKGATVTQWNGQCESASSTVTDCAASPANGVIGVAQTVNTNTVLVKVAPSQSPINASAAVTLGHTVCWGSTAGQVTDSGGTSPCTNSQGAQAGIVMQVAGTKTLTDGTTVALSTTLPLVAMISAGGSAPTSFQVASLFGFVCNGSFDNTAAITSVPSGSFVYLPDNSVCNVGTGATGGSPTWANNVKYLCNGCTFKYAGAVTNYPFTFSGSNQSFEGVTFDLGNTNTGSYQGSSIATTAVTVTGGGTGFAPSQSFMVQFTGGGCTDQPLGFATANGSGVVTSVTLVRPGTLCTSNPTINTTFTAYPACPRGGTCTAPTFTYATPTNTAGPAHTYGVYVTGTTNFLCTNCGLKSTSSTANSMSLYMDGWKIYNSSNARLIRPTVANTVAGYQIRMDSNGTTKYGLVEHCTLDGSGFDAIQIASSNSSGTSNMEVSGCQIGQTNPVTDVAFGTGQGGNGISIFESSNNSVHDAWIYGSQFSGVRITGASSTSQTHLTNHNIVSRVHVVGCGEVGIWAELGAEENEFNDLDVTGCNAGANLNNSNQRPNNGTNLLTNSRFDNLQLYGVLFQHDRITDTSVTNAPICYELGNGGTGYDVVESKNKCYSSGISGTITSQLALAADTGLTSGSSNYGLTVDPVFAAASAGVGSFAQAGPVVSAGVSNSAGMQITAMTLANPPSFTFNTGSATVVNGQTWILQNIPSATLSDGVTPVTSQLCTIGSAASTSFTCTNLNTTGGAAFALPSYGNPAATATKLYSAGTTQLTFPSQVVLSTTTAIANIINGTQGGLVVGGGAGNAPQVGAAGSANQMAQSGGTGAASFADFPELFHQVFGWCLAGSATTNGNTPAANGMTHACPGSTTVRGSYEGVPNAGTPQSTNFNYDLPLDWNTAVQPFITINWGSGANTTGTVIWTVSTGCTKRDGTVTQDPALNAESAMGTQTVTAANRQWGQTAQLTALTSGNNCIAGSQVVIKLAVSGTASSNVDLFSVDLATPRRPVVQAY